MNEISIKSIKDFSVAHESDHEAKTGVTVIYFPNGAAVGSDISGGGPASRETPLTTPTTAADCINALVLGGGSAFGLCAADGVMQCLESHGIGYDTGFARVPLVCQSDIFDLNYGKSNIRPNAEMGRAACEKALSGTSDEQGNIGCGTGASVGKIKGTKRGDKSGFGIYAIKTGEIFVAALVCVNALGDIFSPSGKKIAGLHTQDRRSFEDSTDALCENITPRDMFTGNTTIGAVITNAKFSKAELCKIASMTRSAYSRSIRPVGTMADGDTIYAASTGKICADINAIGALAARVMSRAIESAVLSAKISDEEFLKNSL
ncbi:MAG: P1 family peptidase [Treponema sp.]|nr:P1 family peptidase [Treponema sp.]